MQFPFATLYHSCEREKWENEILLTHEVEETREKKIETNEKVANSINKYKNTHIQAFCA